MNTVPDDLIRAFLADEARRAAATAPSLHEAVGRLAPRWEGRPSGASQRLIILVAAVLLMVAALGALAAGSGLFRLPHVTDAENPTVLGIFEPVNGRIVYYADSSLWGVDPTAPAEPAARIQLDSDAFVPMAWSSDGTRLLIMRQTGGDELLFVLHADGSETQVTERPMAIRGATISPDGSRVVFAGASDTSGGRWRLYSVNAEGGPAEVLVRSRIGILDDLSFSPDGTRIVYADGFGDNNHHVSVMNADGSDAQEIVSQDCACHVYGLAWSPAGDRIALGIEGTIYTFEPDGSDFTPLITGGDQPSWSPDGSQLAYTTACMEVPAGCGFAIADADGSNVVRLDSGTSGPWHPGTPESALWPTPAPSPAENPTVLGIFEPVNGRIVYYADSSLWGVDPTAPAEPAARIQLDSDAFVPMAWSSDGTRLLIMRGSPGEEHLLVLHADGSETPLTDRPMSIGAATFSADGSRVVFAAAESSDEDPADDVWAVYAVDADGGPAAVPASQVDPFPAALTFSPDGTRIAYVLWGHGDGEHPVWVMDVDGTDAHEILANDIVMGAGHVRDRRGAVAWSPAGDRIALALEGTIYTFATDGSDFRRAMSGNTPLWSPDGSQLVSRSSATWHPGMLENGDGG